MITVPLYDTLGDEAVQFIIEKTALALTLVDDAVKATRELYFSLYLSTLPPSLQV